MLLTFFTRLREYRVPVSIRELLDLLHALSKRLVYADIEQFYFLSRLCLVKDEKYYDRFDLAFSDFFKGLDDLPGVFAEDANLELLRETLGKLFPRHGELDLTDLIKEYQRALAEMREARLQGCEGDTGEPAVDDGEPGASRERREPGQEPGGESGAESGEGGDEGGEGNKGDDGEEGEEGDGEEGEEGEGDEGESGEGEQGREGEGEGGEKGLGSSDRPGTGIRADSENVPQRSAVKVWQLRAFEDYDPDVELGTRNMKMGLRRLRKFARTSAQFELDLEDTIRCTAKNGGILDIREVPERHNAVKVLLFLDVGGSMDEHVELCAQLFSAARSEFKYLEYYYFHNFIYESVWKTNERRTEDRLQTFDILHRFGSDYKLIFVGDASMARHEIAEKGGSVEHYNSEPGEVWLSRLQDRFRKIAWLNPVDPSLWGDSYSIEMIRRLMENEMYHLSVSGIEQAMKSLAR